MEEVETAAADTTSEHSFATHHQAHAHHHAYQPDHMTAPTYSMAAQQQQSYSDNRTTSWDEDHGHVTSGEGSEEDSDESIIETSSPASKRPRMDVPFGSPGIQMSSKTSMHHVRRLHGSRPVGIAQPIQLQDTCSTQQSEHVEALLDMPDTELEKIKFRHDTSTAPPSSSAQVQSTATSVRSKQSSNTSKFGEQDPTTLFSQDLVMPQDGRGSANYLEEVYDSDQSQETQRFNKFINESGGVAIGGLPKKGTRMTSSHESLSSDASSESTGQFMATYATTSVDSFIDSDSFAHTGSAPGQESPVETPAGLSSEPLLGMELEGVPPFSHKRDHVREKRRNPPSHVHPSQPLESSLPLPHNKKWHLFVSHSTSNQDLARDEIVARLTSAPHQMRVAACYQSMPDSSRYNDKEIHSRMKESCVVLIALSPLYLQSGRCDREWKLALELHQAGRVPRLVVAAVDVCSRPHPLKTFLYLDFMDRSKRENVWGKLLEEINTAVHKMLPPSAMPVSPQQPAFDDRHSHDEDEVFSGQIPLLGQDTGYDKRYPLPDDSAPSQRGRRDAHTAEFQKDVGRHEQSASEVETEDMSYDSSMYHRQLQAGFEAMYEEMGQDTSQSEGEREGSSVCRSDSDEITDPRASNPSGEPVSQVSQVERDSVGTREVAEVRKGDVEEGEVSDSSDETGGRRKHKKSKGQSQSEVAMFYNQLAQPDADRRNESPIFYMRNFNNWVKSILIRSHLSQLPPRATVLDLCCGKGGDMLKWKEGRIEYLVCADISEDSVKTCENNRYYSDKMILRSTGRPPFDAEFIVADCCEVRLRDKYRNPARRFNLTSCQFSIHYSFESYRQAHMMIRNACENLRPNGFFIGTTVDANEVVHRLRKAGQNEEGLWSIGNNIFTVTLDPSLDINHIPLFGARYNFKLHGVVDLPEYLVHFPLLVDMLKDFDMELVLRQNFYDFFAERRHNTDDIQLLQRMKAFNPRTGSMSHAEWEVIGLYLVFVFRKRERR